jgi:hypothetical protein
MIEYRIGDRVYDRVTGQHGRVAAYRHAPGQTRRYRVVPDIEPEVECLRGAEELQPAHRRPRPYLALVVSAGERLW